MAKMTFSGKWGRVSMTKKQADGASGKSDEEIVREMKSAAKPPAGEDYRERSLAIHGLVCARCGKDFSGAKRHLLTVHHKDGNHHHNPPDGSNWENLCVYCHEDVHSRGVLAEYLSGSSSGRETALVFAGGSAVDSSSEGLLAQKLRQALVKKKP